MACHLLGTKLLSEQNFDLLWQLDHGEQNAEAVAYWGQSKI